MVTVLGVPGSGGAVAKGSCLAARAPMFVVLAAKSPALDEFKSHPLRLLGVLYLHGVVRAPAAPGVHRQRQAVLRAFRGKIVFSGVRDLSRNRLRRRVRDRGRLP